ncbi:MAG: glycosyltransferase family 9 protein [Candidatus Helarchaeota archaeon]|nr:glycosyltransferase family 9 protein [Candidatus Helarchaeota archaeon]
MKLLILALAGIGDSLMFSPALKILRKNLPNAEIHILTMFPGAEEIYAYNNNADRKIHFNFLKEGIIKSLIFVKKMRKEKYDVTINVYPMNRCEYNIISFLIGAKVRIGHTYNYQNIRNLNFLHTKKIKEDDNLHNVIENIRLLKFLGIEADDIPELSISIPEDDLKFSRIWIKESGLTDNDFIIGFHPGSSTLKNHINKRWLPENFASLGNILIDKYDVKILLFGGPEEKKLRENINKIMKNNGIIVETESLLKTIAIMKYCKLFITNDTALMHIASALKLNIVSIFGPTSEVYALPWKTNYKLAKSSIECRPCFYYSPRHLTCALKNSLFACIRELSVNDVLEKAEELIMEIDK